MRRTVSAEVVDTVGAGDSHVEFPVSPISLDIAMPCLLIKSLARLLARGVHLTKEPSRTELKQNKKRVTEIGTC